MHGRGDLSKTKAPAPETARESIGSDYLSVNVAKDRRVESLIVIIRA